MRIPRALQSQLVEITGPEFDVIEQLKHFLSCIQNTSFLLPVAFFNDLFLLVVEAVTLFKFISWEEQKLLFKRMCLSWTKIKLSAFR